MVKREKSHIWLRLIRWGFRSVFHGLKHLRGEPDQIARGAAIGMFIALTPTMGIQTILALFAATIFKANRLIAGIFVWITNVFTVIPIYFVVLWVGKWMLRKQIEYSMVEKVVWTDWTSYYDFFIDHFYALWIGAFVLGTFSAAISYVMMYYLAIYYRKIREKKKAARLSKKLARMKQTEIAQELEAENTDAMQAPAGEADGPANAETGTGNGEDKE